MNKLIATLMLAVGALGLMALPAGANNHQPTQRGLVNVYVDDVTVQVPVSVALNLCDVNVAVLVDTFEDDAAECNAEGGSIAVVPTGEADAPVIQNGLVNVARTDVTAQIPIGIAANLCDINVALLVSDFEDAAAECQATAESNATDGDPLEIVPVIDLSLLS
jgi:hypothetical protein